VRDPFDWYGSFWQMCHRERIAHRAWAYSLAFSPQTFVNLPFPQFLSGCYLWLPGYVSELYTSYVALEEDPIHFVGRFERLADDLVRALQLANQDFDEDALRSVAPTNTSAAAPPCPPEIKQRVIQSELVAYKRFYGIEPSSKFETMMGSDIPNVAALI
jgi:hypothetical protein